MGNFHCVESDCARVVWREYLPPSVRYKYPDDLDWTYIDGADDFNVERELGQCDTPYRVKGRAPLNGLANCGASWQIDPTPTYPWTVLTTGKVIGLTYEERGTRDEYLANENGSCNFAVKLGVTPFCFAYLAWEGQTSPSEGGLSFFYGTWLEEFFNDDPETMHQIDSIERMDGFPDDCGACVLSVYANGELIFEEGNAQCPEVEVLPCRLAEEFKEIRIDKLPYLERIEVVPYQYSSYSSPGVPAPIVQADEIPAGCLNIYSNNILTFLPYNQENPETALNPNATPFNSFINQICSAPGCPPPEFDVICNCVEDCPPGTCSVVCGSSICCYDTSTGSSVKEIPISDFFPNNTRGAGS